MSRIYQGDDWMNADNGKPGATFEPTRAQEQARIDREFGEGLITRERWSFQTDELSRTERWTAQGKRKHQAMSEADRR